MEPKYLELYQKLRDRIVGGSYAPGQRLPSKRVLAADLGVSIITVQHAYEILCDEGYVESRQRQGYFAAYRDSDGFAVGTNSPALIRAAMTPATMSSEGLPSSVLSKTVRCVLNRYPSELTAKTDPLGAAFLRDEIARYLARNRGIKVSSDCILVGSGAESLYGRMIQLLGRNRIYAMETPSYDKIMQIYKHSGVEYRLLPLGTDGIVSSALRDTDAEVLHITPYQSFPTGVTASASKRREYLNWVNTGDRYLIEDDFESEFTVSTKVEDTLLSFDTQGRVIYINTFSRTIAPGIRIAYTVMPAELAAMYRKKLSFYSCPVPTLVQYLVAELLQNGEFERHINRVRRVKRKQLRSEKLS